MLYDTKESRKKLWSSMLRPLALFSEKPLDSKQNWKYYAWKNNLISIFMLKHSIHPLKC